MAVQPAHSERAAAARRVGAAADYTARHLSVLEGLEAVRKRPGMYIGSTDSRGLMHCLWEIIDNSVDEALGGHCHTIDVVLHRDGSVEVRDDGRGIPVDVEPKTGLSGVEVVFTKLHAGGKFGGGSYAASGGLHGVGATVVNALSARLDVEVDRDGKTWAMSFRRGEPGVFAPGDDGPQAPFTPFVDRSELRVSGEAQARRHRHPGPLLGRPADLPRRGRLLLRRARRPRPADRVPRAGPDASASATSAGCRARPASTARTRRSSVHEGGISEFVEFLGDRRAGHRRAGGCTGAGTSPRPCRCSTSAAT